MNLYFKKQLKNLFYIIFLFFLLIIILISINLIDNRFVKVSHNNIKNCNELNYVTSKFIQNENFQKFNINLLINDERKWKRILLNNQLSFLNNNNFANNKKIKAQIIFSINGFKCLSQAIIRPHGDTPVHHLDENNNILSLPSIKVNLIDNNIFGVTKFILFKPAARHYKNEVFITTVLDQLGILAPRTSMVNVEFSNNSYEFIFQERIVKEFLENNNLIEGPIFKGDERFAFNYWQLNDYPSNHKLSNGNWILKNKNNELVSQKALNVINFIAHFNSSEIKANKIADYIYLSKSANLESYFDEFEFFDSAMYAFSTVHNLSIDDRRYYYDSVKNKFIPIYYDGKGSIINKKNNINEDFKNIKKNWYFAMIKYKDQDLKMRAINQKVTPSAIKGAHMMIKKIKNLDVNLIQTNLSKRGLNLSKEKIVNILYLVTNNLKYISKLDKNNVLKIKIDLNKKPFTKDIQNIIKAKYIFENSLNNNYLVCNLDLSDCLNKNKFDINHKKLFEQSLISENKKFDLIYKGQINNFINKSIKFQDDAIDLIKVNDKFKIINLNKNILKINQNNRSIHIEKINPKGRILIIGDISKWKFYFIDNFKSEKYDISRDQYGLTGCINIYDSYLENISFYISDAKCEDGLNIVRSNGSIEALNVYNSISDGVDFDFSNILVNNLNIVKSKGDCIDFSYGNYDLLNAKFDKCDDKSISLGEKSNLKVNLAKVYNSNIALASKDSSEATIENINITESLYCLQAYNKKTEFSGAVIYVEKMSCNNSINFEKFIYKDNRSNIVFNSIQ
tara:strand:- start:1101 stop:3476 length:2376 start_codon:yes stop_codon:yes gene_type:complete